MEASDDIIIEWMKCRVHANSFHNNLWECHHSNAVHDFIHQPTVTKLFVTVDKESNELIVCSSAPPEPSADRVDVTYFVKAEGQILSPENLGEVLIYGTIAIKQTATSVLKIMEEEFYPNIFQSRVWNQSSKQELQGLYHRFMASLTESANEESGTTILYLPFKNLTSCEANNILCDKNIIQQLEAIAIHWIRQVKEVLNSHEHSITLDHQGPMEELIFWEARAEDLAGISQQLHCAEVLDILSILNKAKSKYAKPVEALAGALHKGSEEAANSVKFLRLLQGPCEQLAKLDAAEISSIMLKFLNCIRLIHVHSANFNTNEKVSDLIRRVSGEIIRQCTFHISLHEIFHGDLEKAMAILNDCINCGKAWKDCYNRMAVTVNKQKNENKDSEEPWKLNDPSIFAETDAFVQRCDDLIDICNSRVQFVERLEGTFNSVDRKYMPTFGWTNGPEIENSVRVIQEAFLVQIDRLKGLEYSILNARESRWHGDYNTFKLATKDLDTMLVNAINGALEQVQVVDAAAHLLQIFHKIAHRPAISNCMEKRTMELGGLFLRQCQKIRQEFDNNHRSPPLRKNEPVGAGSALWASALCTSVEQSWNSLCNSSARNLELDDHVESVFSELVRSLTMYQTQKYTDWIESLAGLDASQLQDKLDQPLLQKLNETNNDILNPLASNFDSEVTSILTEALCWDKLHNEEFITPNEVLGICHQREVLRITFERVMMLVRAYNDFLHDLKGTSTLYLDHLKLLEKKLRPGFVKIMWSSRPAVTDKFVQTMLEMIHSFHREVRKLHCSTSRIHRSCQEIASTLMIRIDHNFDYKALQFEAIQTEVRNKARDAVFKLRDDIEIEVNKIFHQFMNGSKEVLLEWTAQLKRFDDMILASLTKAIRLSLKDFVTAVGTAVDVIPLFSTQAHLENGKIECSPTLISITNSANNVVKQTVGLSKGLSTLSKNQESSQGNMFYDAIASDEIVLNSIVTIMNKMRDCTFSISEKICHYDKYRSLWSMDLQSYLRRYSKSSQPSYDQDIRKFLTQQNSLEAEKSLCRLNFILLDFTILKTELCNHALDFKSGLLSLLKRKTEESIAAIYLFVQDSSERLQTPLSTIDDLGDMIELSAQVEHQCKGVENEFLPLFTAKSILEKYGDGFKGCESLDGITAAFDALLACITKTQNVVSKTRVEMKSAFQERHEETLCFQKHFCTQVDEALMADAASVSDAKELLKKLEGEMEERKRRERQLIRGLDLFQMDLVESKNVRRAEAIVQLVSSTVKVSEEWDTVRKKCSEIPLSSLDFDAMSNDIKLFTSCLLKMDRDIREFSFWTNLKRDLETFKDLSPLMVALGNVDMRERHWDSIQEMIGKSFNFCEGLNLSKALSLELDQPEKLNFVVQISGAASKEFSIENYLDEVEVSISECILEFDPHKENGLKVTVPDDFFSMLEDFQVTIAATKASPAGAFFMSRVLHIDSLLKKATELFEAVLLVQKQWIYLENIFQGAGDIAEQLPLASDKFARVHKDVSTTILQLQEQENLHAILNCNDISIQSLHDIFRRMEEISCSLNKYLESKRRSFPRFYFISDDDLLEMIGRSSQPQLIQKYVKKCFEGIHTLKLAKNHDGSWIALGGDSADDESIMFEKSVPIVGSIEVWLEQIQSQMKATMITSLENAFRDRKALKPQEWVPKWQGQLLITSGALAYTKRCQRALAAIKSGKDKNALRALRKKYVSFLRRLTEIVRSGDIDATNRSKIVALITTEIHHRDVIEKMLRSSCHDPTEFIWRSQLKFFLNEGLCEVQQNTYKLDFGYEYVGNSGRLVITPLTDRCVLTMLTALSLYRGGNPLGPAGTGKTETVKDLAKNLAFFCVVTNCSENFDFKSLGRIFSGLCQSGAWGCFDEFNRIKIEVISVAAVQIGSILNAQRSKLDSFSFFGTEIPCRKSTGLFFTLNPGYAGRTELPDNLKAILRPVAMMAPDLVFIAEVILASEGFVGGKGLAQRMVVIYSLMKQQLSKCCHYDFGLRNIKSVLTMAGSLKRQNSNEDEATIIIKSLIGLNEPRFIGRDKDLFRLLLADLFPEKKLQQSSDAALVDAIKTVMKSNDIYPSTSIVEKTVQLAQSQNTRHSNMLIGQTMAGKSTIWKTLRDAKQKLDPRHPDYASTVNTHVLNPKALTIAELYGLYDGATFEWKDGVISRLFKSCAESDNEVKGSVHWIIFDGPVDALWIESMNSVMDDSKLLTLINGDRVSMTKNMSLLFEVEDLKVASPATVSRAAMTFVDCGVEWRVVIQKWFDDAQSGILTESKDHISDFCEKYLDSVLAFKAEHCFEPVPLNDVAALSSFTQLFNVLLSSAPSTNTDKALIEKKFIFCIVWTIGGALDNTSRKLLDQHLRGLEAKVMPTRSIYDYFVDSKTNEFTLWTKMADSNSLPESAEKMPCHDIVVSTLDTVRNSYVLNSFLDNGHRILITGGRGTGKTLICESYLRRLTSQSQHLKLGLSRTTTSDFLQSFIGASLEKISKGTFGPRSGGKRLVVFLDDLNIPKKTSEESPFQPPLELLRQLIDYGGWYNRGSCTWEKIININLLSAMAHPTGGREIISSRTQSRFSLLNCTEYESKQLTAIFSSLLHCKLSFLPDDVKEVLGNISDATVGIFKRVRKDYLPIPGKFHYKFDLRDVLKVAYGMCLIDRKNSNFQTKEDLYSLWRHECMRTFSDRFVDDVDNDMERFTRIIVEVQNKHIGNTIDVDSSYFLPISQGQVYQRCKESTQIEKQISKYLEDYNETGSSIPMPLVLFRNAVNHICRIQRILMLDRGNMLFVGVGGSGRESLSRLAAFASNYEFFRIEVSRKYRRKEFLEDLKSLIMRCGLENIQILFFLKDTDIQEEIFLEDISSLLDSGEVHGCFGKEDVIAVCDGIRKDAAAAGLHESNDKQLWEFFVERVRKNLRIIIAFSSIGQTFASRIESFPALMNCACVNWFNPWPKSALEEIARDQVLGDKEDEDLSFPDELPCSMASLHDSAARTADEMKSSVQRYNYVTPTNYLEFIRTFKKIYRTKRTVLDSQKEKLSGGLKKLQVASNEVVSMRLALEKKQLLVKDSQNKCEIMLEQIMIDKKRTEKQQQSVEMESKQIAVEERKCSTIAQDAEADLAIALPALQSALEEVQKLDKSSLTELKAYANPPLAVEKTLACVMIFMNKPTDWASAKRSMGDINFLHELKSYDKDKVKPLILTRVEKIVASPSFAPSEITRISKAAGALCSWCHAIHMYSNVAKEVAPKRERLRLAQDSLVEKQAALQNAKEALTVATEKLMNLKEKYDQSVNEKNKLADEAKTLTAKLGRAEKLVNGLSSEYKRWTDTINALKSQSDSLLGDVVVATAFLSYGGPFQMSFRAKLIAEWVCVVERNGIQISKDYSVNNVLGNEKEIQTWNNQGLSTDAFSTQNALIIKSSNRWPLVIDPQGQASKWLKAMYGDSLKVLDLKKKEYLRELETAISFGLPVLLYNVLEELDSNLDPVLNKAVILSGSRNVLRLGDKEIDYNDNFRLFIVTKLENPHYPPEILAKVTLINFGTTPTGLEEQLLGLIVTEEAPALEIKKREVTTKLFSGRNRLVELEDDILRILAGSNGNLIDDIELIKTLQDSKNLADAVSMQLREAEETARKIDAARNVYRSTAKRSSTVFFTVMSMNNIDPMYQFSLDSYLADFHVNIASSRVLNRNSDSDSDSQALAEDRVKSIIEHHTIEIFKSICIALFEKDKMLFALQLCCNVMLEERKLSSVELDFICYGSIISSKNKLLSKPSVKLKWMEVKAIRSLPELQLVVHDIIQNIEEDQDSWREWYRSESPETHDLPVSCGTDISEVQRLCIIRALRFDRFTNCTKFLVKKHLGEEFISSHPFDLLQAYKRSTPKTPLLIILSPGVDPVSQVVQVADAYSKNLVQVALGQGQGASAVKAIEEACISGDWVFLANCHLMPTWMNDELEAVIARLQAEKTSSHFRLWLSSKPTSIFPLSILQNAVKITTEPPRGLVANLKNVYCQVGQQQFDDCGEIYGYKKLLFCLAWMHCVLIERRRFKNLGFNVQYDFSNSDFEVCNDILGVMLGNDNSIPFDALQYLIGEAIYGGRVTDEWDRRLLMVLVKTLFCQEAVDQPSFALGGEYTIPHNGTMVSYKTHISSFPTYDHPSAFGQHTNAQVASQVEDAKRLLGSLSLLRPDKQTKQLNPNNGNDKGRQCLDKLKAVPQCLDMKRVSAYENHSLDSSAMKTFLVQEVERYNELLNVIHSTRVHLEDGINGKAAMTSTLETQLKTLSEFQVPTHWQHLYNSTKPLDSWISELYKRVRQLELWIDNGAPKIFWLGGFSNPSGFLTAVLQTEARRKNLSIDFFTWNFNVITTVAENHLEVPNEGVYISGLFLEGASYDVTLDCLLDPKPMQLLFNMPIIHFQPTESPKKPVCEKYTCPMYICPDRAGPSQSPSYFFSLNLNSGEKSSDHWVKRGVAILLTISE